MTRDMIALKRFTAAPMSVLTMASNTCPVKSTAEIPAGFLAEISGSAPTV